MTSSGIFPARASLRYRVFQSIRSHLDGLSDSQQFLRHLKKVNHIVSIGPQQQPEETPAE